MKNLFTKKVIWISGLSMAICSTTLASSGYPTYPPAENGNHSSLTHLYSQVSTGETLDFGNTHTPDKRVYTLNEIMNKLPKLRSDNYALTTDVSAGFKYRTVGDSSVPDHYTNPVENNWDGHRLYSDCPRTGQDYSFHHGDDGLIHAGWDWPNPRFSDNGDGTITDEMTYLVWLKNPGLLVATNWTGALDQVNALKDGDAGLSDGSVAGKWRLPNIRELNSLMAARQKNPALPWGHPFLGIQSTHYWSSTTYAPQSGEAFVLDLNTGAIQRRAKNTVQKTWAVRDKFIPIRDTEEPYVENREPPASPFDPASAMYHLEGIYEHKDLNGNVDELRTGGFEGPTGPPSSVFYYDESSGEYSSNLRVHCLDSICDRTMQVRAGARPASPNEVREGKYFYCLIPGLGVWGEAIGTASSFALHATGQTNSFHTGDDGDLLKGIAPIEAYDYDVGRDEETVKDGYFYDRLIGLLRLNNSTSLPQANWYESLDCANALKYWDPTNSVFYNGSQLGLGHDENLQGESKAGEWRMPNKNELFSLVNFSYTNAPMTLRVVEGWHASAETHVQAAKYWTSTTCAHDLGKAWAVDFTDGTLVAVDKSESCYLWPVSDGKRNSPPLLEAAMPHRQINVEDVFSFSFPTNMFVDPEGDTITYSANQAQIADGYSAATAPYYYSDTHTLPLPDWIQFDPQTITFSGTNNVLTKTNNIITVAVHAKDAHGENTAVFVFEATNPSPYLNRLLLDQYRSHNESFEYIFASDSFMDLNHDSDELTYTATQSNGDPLPSWISFDGPLRKFSGTTPNVASLVITVKVTAADPWGYADHDTFDYTITNGTPRLTKELEDQEFYIDTAFESIFDSDTFVDPDDDTLTYTATLSDGSALPSWLSFDESLRKFYGTTTSDSSIITIKLIASDPFSAEDSSEFLFRTVVPAPVYHGLLTDQVAQSSVPWTYTFPTNTFTEEVLTPPDLTYTAELDDGDELPDWLSFDGPTRTFSGTPPSWSDSIDIAVFAKNIKNASSSDTFELQW